MARYRQVHTSFWQDTFVLDLTPEEKYFYLYLMTNSKTSACGIYELPKKIIEMETGYNLETVTKLLTRFVEYGKIRYSESTKEIFLVNWLRFNEPKSDLTARCVIGELNSVKHRGFAEEYLEEAELLGYQFKGATKGLDSPYQVREREMEMDKEKDMEKEMETDATSPSPTILVSGLNREAWKQWLNYRTSIKKPLKQASIPAAQRSLAAFGSDQAAVVEQSIANGWQGLFDLKRGSSAQDKKPAPTKAFPQQ